MRAHLVLSALFAASLFGGAAMADRPGVDDGAGRTSRLPVRELRVHEAREQQQVRERSHEATANHVRETKVTEHLRSHGDMIDRAPKASSAQSKAASGNELAGMKAQRETVKAMRQLEEKKNAVINCGPTEDSCTPSARSARVAAEAGQKASQQAEANKQREEIQKMIEKIRAERLKAIMMKEMCAKIGNLCAERL